MIGSLAIMTVLYIAVVGAVIELAERDVLIHGGPNGGASLAPMADGAGALFAGFREDNPVSYDPEFTSPGYPYVQVFGLAAGIGLLTQMGTVPILGAAGIIAGGVVL